MTNPYESPQSSAKPTDPAPVTGQDVGQNISGFFSALLMTVFLGAVFGFPLQMVLSEWLPEPFEVLVIFLSSPAVTGPICSLILWLRNRKRNRAFATGAVTFGVASFLLIGGCFVVGAALN